MDFLQSLTVLGGNFGLFIASASFIAWFRSESRSDWRHMDAKLDASISAIREEMKEYREESNKFREMWHAESKEFHERLIKIEMEKLKK